MNSWLPAEWWGVEVGREGTVKDFGNIMHTLLYLKWITNTHLMYSIWKSAQCYVAA